jgi:hypothetical protein
MGQVHKRSDQRFRWSRADLWAWLDLNQRPHPYQQSRAYRYATLRFRRWRVTVRGKVMRSYSHGRTSAPTRCHGHSKIED